MNTFTIAELDIIHACLTDQIRTSKILNIGAINMLEHIADKCIEARINAGYKSPPIHFNDLINYKEIITNEQN